MSKNRKFLTPIAVLIAGLSLSTHAATENQSSETNENPQYEQLDDKNTGDDSFILKPSNSDNQKATGHYSHRSHQSHQSHQSHFSSSTSWDKKSPNEED